MSHGDAVALFNANRSLAFSGARRALRQIDRPLPAWMGREDLESLALMALWDACRNYDSCRGPFGSYAWCAIMRRLRRAIHRAAGIASGTCAAPSPVDHSASIDAREAAVDRLEMEMVLNRLRRLPARTLRATILAAQGHTPSEIGRALGISRQRAWQLPREAAVYVRRELAEA